MGTDQRTSGTEWTGEPRRTTTALSTVLNFFPATFSSDTVKVGVGRWVDKVSTERLRDDNPGLRTWRDGEDGSRLYVWYMDDRDSLPAEFQRVTVQLDEAPSIFKRMLGDAIERRFLEIGFERKGVNAFVNYGKPSLLCQVPSLREIGGPLGIYPKIIPRVHYTRNASDELVIGVVADVLYTTRLDIPLSEWVAAGLIDEVRGGYVSLLPGTLEAAERPDLVGRSLGKIDAIQGRVVRLSDPRDPKILEVDSSAVAPEPTRINLAAYLHARHERAWEQGQHQLRRRIEGLVRPARRYELATAVVDRLVQGTPDGIQVRPELHVTFGRMLRVGGSEFPISKLKDPSYRFDTVNDASIAGRVDVGLRKFGPYDQGQQRPRHVRILVLGLEENQREIDSAVRKLVGGVNTAKPVFAGLKAMYRLPNLDVTCAYAPKSSAKEMVRYADAAAEAIRSATARGVGESKFDLVIVVTHERFKAMPDSENPYYQTKALALVLDGVPTQAIFMETVRQDDYSLQYSLNTMALACYAKMGGKSHVLDVEGPEDGVTELVFGVGRAMVGEARHSGRDETIGFATVFRSNGQYLYNDCTPYCRRDTYEGALEKTIIGTVKKVAAYEGLREGAHLRLIFHVPRRPGKHEEMSVLNAVGKLPQFKIEFALVHVNDDHHFQAFDTMNVDGQGWKGKKEEAKLMTKRGLCVALGPDERLVTFVGPDQYRGHGSPGPVLVRLDHRSTVKDVDYVAQQLYWLSFMNAGSLNPGHGPASIVYAEKLAKLTGHLRGVQQWTVDLIHTKLGWKLWFI